MFPQDGRAASPAATPKGGLADPVFRALAIIEKCLQDAQRENRLVDLVRMDLRSVETLRARFTAKANDPDSLKLLRQLTMVWSTRLSGADSRTFRELRNLIEKCVGPNA